MNPKIVNVEVKYPVYNYLNSLLRLKCFPELSPLFLKSSQPAKELTESYAAYRNLKDKIGSLPVDENTVYLHIGDGAYPRTSTMFAYLVGGNHISIDPTLNIEWIDNNLSHVRGITFKKSKIEEYNLSDIQGKRVILVFVHSHVDTQNVIDMINLHAEVIAAYINPCCYPNKQLLPNFPVTED